MLSGKTSGCAESIFLATAHCLQALLQLHRGVLAAAQPCSLEGTLSTRLVNKELSHLWKVPTSEGNSISGPFRPEELAAVLKRLKPGKSLGLDFIFQEFILHAWSAFKFWFCNFLTFCMRQLKIPKIWRRTLIVTIPKPEKPLGDPKSYRRVSLLYAPSRSSRHSSALVSNQSSTHCSRSSRRVFDMGFDRRSGHVSDTGHRE